MESLVESPPKLVSTPASSSAAVNPELTIVIVVEPVELTL